MINSTIIFFCSFSATSLDRGLIYVVQGKNSQILEYQFVRNIAPGEELHFTCVCRSKTSIRMQVYLKVTAGSIELEKVNLTRHRVTFLAFYLTTIYCKTEQSVSFLTFKMAWCSLSLCFLAQYLILICSV